MPPIQATSRSRTRFEAVNELYAEFYSKPNSSTMEAMARDILAPNWQGRGDYSGEAVSVDQMIAIYRGFGAAVPNITVAPQEILTDGERHVVRSKLTGTPTSAFLGLPATGRGFSILTIDIHRFLDDRIVETYHLEDWAGAARQLSAG